MEESYLGKCLCIHCHEVKSTKGIFVHVDRAHLGSTKYSSGNNGKYDQVAASIKENTKRRKQPLIEEYLKNPSRCKECNITLPFEQRELQFCSHSCSASFLNRKRLELGLPYHLEETRQKISKSVTGKTYPRKHTCHVRVCEFCQITFELIKSLKKFCSKNCRTAYNMSIRKDPTNLKEYRIAAAFRFNLSDYPTEYDFLLVEKFGWYAAKNKGDNLYGVSRDHIVSMKYGFENNIDPKIIAHPANCQLLPHSQNVSKSSECHMTIEELLDKIKNWEIKYS